jgi:CheY-like chemotaxis protein
METSVATSSQNLRTARLRILLVEDDEQSRRMMSLLLSGVGYEVTAAQSIANALEAAKSADFDCVIADIGLPDGSGLELMRALLARGNTKGIAVNGIALTGLTDPSKIEECRQAGFKLHVAKPVNFDDLQAILSGMGMGLTNSTEPGNK